MAVAAIAAIFLYNFLLGVKAMRDVRSGRREIARWTVTAGELDEFRTNDTARNALGRRVRAGLIAAPIFFLIAAGGFWLSASGADRSELPLVMAVGGVIAGFGGLILAFAAWILRARKGINESGFGLG